MVAPAIRVEGGPELRRSLKQLGVDLRDLSALHKKIAADVCQVVEGTAPRTTGRLAGSFRPSGTRTMARARSSLVYAPVIEYGWPRHNIEGQKYAERALASSAPKVKQEYSQGIDKLLRKAES